MSNFFKHTLVKVFTLNGISVLIKMIVSFLSAKLYAIFLGPEGFAIMGNFKNFSASIKTFSTIGFDNGIVSLVSKAKENHQALQKIYATAFYSRLIGSMFISIILFLLPNYINTLLFEGQNIKTVIYLFATVLPFYAINNLLLSILNGLGRFNKLIFINILSTIVGFIILIPSVFYLKTNGVFYYLSIVESIIIVVTLLFLRNEKVVFSIKNFDQKIIYKLLSFSLMTLTSAIIVPGSNLFIRDLIIENLSTLQAGYWESLNVISGYYMLIITSTISIYYLPKISRVKTIKGFNKEYKNYLKVFGSGFVLMGIIIFGFRNSIISLILTKEFQPVSDLLIYQLTADFFKLVVLFFGYKMIADRDVKRYIIVEVLFYAVYISLSFLAANKLQNTKYVVISYMISYITILILMISFYKKHLFKKSLF
ncbi:O-antigen translocase [Wenyingzhuangia sp. IMCC45533]